MSDKREVGPRKFNREGLLCPHVVPPNGRKYNDIYFSES